MNENKCLMCDNVCDYNDFLCKDCRNGVNNTTALQCTHIEDDPLSNLRIYDNLLAKINTSKKLKRLELLILIRHLRAHYTYHPCDKITIEKRIEAVRTAMGNKPFIEDIARKIEDKKLIGKKCLLCNHKRLEDDYLCEKCRKKLDDFRYYVVSANNPLIDYTKVYAGLTINNYTSQLKGICKINTMREIDILRLLKFLEIHYKYDVDEISIYERLEDIKTAIKGKPINWENEEDIEYYSEKEIEEEETPTENIITPNKIEVIENKKCLICNHKKLDNDYLCEICRNKLNNFLQSYKIAPTTHNDVYNLLLMNNVSNLKKAKTIREIEIMLLLQDFDYYCKCDVDETSIEKWLTDIKTAIKGKPINWENEEDIEYYSEKEIEEEETATEEMPTAKPQIVYVTKAPSKMNKKEIEQAFYSQHIKCEDGHYVRSRAEKIIDDFLYRHNIVHTYESDLYTGERIIHPDWYLPEYDVYIEHWGVTGNEGYNNTKRLKLETYKNLDLKLIETYDEDINNIEKILRMKLNIIH